MKYSSNNSINRLDLVGKENSLNLFDNFSFKNKKVNIELRHDLECKVMTVGALLSGRSKQLLHCEFCLPFNQQLQK